MKRVTLERAYVLHRRSYRETSFLLEVFTQQQGRFTVIAKGARNLRSALPGMLQPFIPLLISFAGRGELMTLVQAELNGEVKPLQGECLFAGFYLNELLMCLLQKWDPHPNLYHIYVNTLKLLQHPPLQQKTLRLFEKNLLEELGYGLMPTLDRLPQTFYANRFYRFTREQGFVLSEFSVSSATSNIFSGESLLALATGNLENEDSLRDAKRLMRFVLAPLLGERPLHSRRLFIKLSGEEDEKNK
jgi:DNA repair protein RecO (recombination protein O)